MTTFEIKNKGVALLTAFFSWRESVLTAKEDNHIECVNFTKAVEDCCHFEASSAYIALEFSRLVDNICAWLNLCTSGPDDQTAFNQRLKLFSRIRKEAERLRTKYVSNMQETIDHNKDSIR